MKKTLVILILLALTTPSFAQWGDEEMEEKADWKERIFTGGGFGMAFSSYQDYISVSPLVGYKITPKLAAGIQVQYRYTNYKTYKFKANDYGISPFIRYNVYPPFFLHAEYEYLNYQFGENIRKNFNSVLAGGGIFQPIGRRAGFYALALYNFSYSASSSYLTPYDSPLVLRAGITAGF